MLMPIQIRMPIGIKTMLILMQILSQIFLMFEKSDFFLLYVT